MADPRFFHRKGPYRLEELARICGGKLGDGADPALIVEDARPLGGAGPRDISFLDNKRYLTAFSRTAAGACVVDPAYADQARTGMSLILTTKPYRAYALIAHAFYDERRSAPGIHGSAVIDASAEIGPGCTIGPAVVIGAGAKIGARVELEAHVVVGQGCSIGEGTWVGSHAALVHCDIGPNTTIHTGARIGQRGFGFDMDAEGYIDVPQLGRVVIGEGVEIGANCTIDRGAGPDTIIGNGCKLDNLVQIGHNVQLGEQCVLVAQSGVAGSSRLDDYVVVAAQGGIAGHLKLGKGAQIGAQAGVMRDVEPGARLVGSPAMPVREFFRMVNAIQKFGRAKGE